MHFRFYNHCNLIALLHPAVLYEKYSTVFGFGSPLKIYVYISHSEPHGLGNVISLLHTIIAMIDLTYQIRCDRPYHIGTKSSDVCTS